MLYYLIALILAPVCIYLMGKTRLKALNHMYGLDDPKPEDRDKGDKTGNGL